KRLHVDTIIASDNEGFDTKTSHVSLRTVSSILSRSSSATGADWWDIPTTSMLMNIPPRVRVQRQQQRQRCLSRLYPGFKAGAKGSVIRGFQRVTRSTTYINKKYDNLHQTKGYPFRRRIPNCSLCARVLRKLSS